MASLPIDLILEAMLALLLMVTVAYCVALDRRLRQLRSGQDGLRDIIKGLDEATRRAQGSITQLKVVGDNTSRDLSEQVTKARALADELALMTETADRLATRLEGGRAVGRVSLRTVDEDGFGRDEGGGLGDPEDDARGRQDRLLRMLREAR